MISEYSPKAAGRLSTYPRPRPVACAPATLTLPVVVVVGMWATRKADQTRDFASKNEPVDILISRYQQGVTKISQGIAHGYAKGAKGARKGPAFTDPSGSGRTPRAAPSAPVAGAFTRRLSGREGSESGVVQGNTPRGSHR